MFLPNADWRKVLRKRRPAREVMMGEIDGVLFWEMNRNKEEANGMAGLSSIEQ